MAKTEKKLTLQLAIRLLITAVTVVASLIAVNYLIGFVVRHAETAGFYIFYVTGRVPYFIEFASALLGSFVFYKLVVKNFLQAFYAVELSLLFTNICMQALPHFIPPLIDGSASPSVFILTLIEVTVIAGFLYASLVVLLRLKKLQPHQLLEGFIVIFLVFYALLLGILHLRVQSFVSSSNQTFKNSLVDNAKKLDFALYKPTYASIKGTTTANVTLLAPNTGYSQNYASLGVYTDDSSAALDHYEIDEYKVNAKFQPPTNCADPTPVADNAFTYPCQKITVAKSGCDVYLDQDIANNQTFAYCKLGDTLVNFNGAASAGYNKDEIVKIFDSLVRVDAQTFVD